MSEEMDVKLEHLRQRAARMSFREKAENLADAIFSGECVRCGAITDHPANVTCDTCLLSAKSK